MRLFIEIIQRESDTRSLQKAPRPLHARDTPRVFNLNFSLIKVYRHSQSRYWWEPSHCCKEPVFVIVDRISLDVLIGVALGLPRPGERMSDLPELPTKSRAASVPALNADDIFGKPPESLTAAKTGLSSADSSIPGKLSNGDRQLWEDSPLGASATTVGAVAVGRLAVKRMPKLTSHAAGLYGASKLLLTDGPDLLSSSGFKDTSKYLLACGSDLTMVAGTEARYIPKTRGIATALTVSGIGGRLTAEFLPETNPPAYFRPEKLKPAPPSSRESVGSSLSDGNKEDRPYDLFVPPGSKSTKMPVVMMLPGVQNDSAPGMERETRLNQMASERGFIAVYPHAKPRQEAAMGKVYDWNSPGSGLTVTDPAYDDVDLLTTFSSQLKERQTLMIRRFTSSDFPVVAVSLNI